MSYEEGFRAGQKELFRRIHELTYECPDSVSVIVAIGRLYGEFLTINPAPGNVGTEISSTAVGPVYFYMDGRLSSSRSAWKPRGEYTTEPGPNPNLPKRPKRAIDLEGT